MRYCGPKSLRSFRWILSKNTGTDTDSENLKPSSHCGPTQAQYPRQVVVLGRCCKIGILIGCAGMRKFLTEPLVVGHRSARAPCCFGSMKSGEPLHTKHHFSICSILSSFSLPLWRCGYSPTTVWFREVVRLLHPFSCQT
jgi:hypothetical protein